MSSAFQGRLGEYLDQYLDPLYREKHYLNNILLIIHLFYAGPMLIAVFITEMVILHKYVYLLFIIYYLLFIIYYLLFIIYYLLFIIYYLLFIIYYLLFIIYYLLLFIIIIIIIIIIIVIINMQQ